MVCGVFKSPNYLPALRTWEIFRRICKCPASYENLGDLATLGLQPLLATAARAESLLLCDKVTYLSSTLKHFGEDQLGISYKHNSLKRNDCKTSDGFTIPLG